MANEYATLAELKAARRMQDNEDDIALQAALTQASRAIDTKTGRKFWLDPAATARVFNSARRVTPDGLLLVDDIGDPTGLTVEIGSGSTWTAVTDYETGPENALARGWAITNLTRPGINLGAWGSGVQRVRITAKWGWPTVPDEIKRATLILANRLYMRKDTPEGVKGTAEWGAIRMSRWDPDVESLVGPYVLLGMA